MKYRVLRMGLVLLVSVACAQAARAQSFQYETGWELGADMIYQLSDSIDFEGGSSIETDDELGFGVAFGYRFNKHFELQFGLQWESIDYDANVQSDSGLEFDARGDMHILTPHVSATYHFLEGVVRPYVTGGVGWSWIDTSIPDGPAQPACWWDPWWGYYCGVYQSTRDVDEPSYKTGLGVRWDVGPAYTLRLGYEKRWIDTSNATSVPGFDQFRLTFLALE